MVHSFDIRSTFFTTLHLFKSHQPCLCFFVYGRWTASIIAFEKHGENTVFLKEGSFDFIPNFSVYNIWLTYMPRHLSAKSSELRCCLINWFIYNGDIRRPVMHVCVLECLLGAQPLSKHMSVYCPTEFTSHRSSLENACKNAKQRTFL